MNASPQSLSQNTRTCWCGQDTEAPVWDKPFGPRPKEHFGFVFSASLADVLRELCVKLLPFSLRAMKRKSLNQKDQEDFLCVPPCPLWLKASATCEPLRAAPHRHRWQVSPLCRLPPT